MSLTPHSPLLRDWVAQGLEWKYLWSPVLNPFVIPANSQVQLPTEKSTFMAPEGVAMTFIAAFDNPLCGIRFESPQLDTGSFFTVANLTTIGAYNQPFFVMALIPPVTPAGVFVIGNAKDWVWTDWARIYVINTDNVPHTCLSYAYTIAVLIKPRERESNIDKIRLILDLFPERRDEIKRKLESKVEEWMRKL
jgi:hypothetical protein